MVVRIGVLGAARISAAALFEPAQNIEGVEVVGLAARNQRRATDQARDAGLSKTYASYAELLADPDLDAVYNPLPISLHHPWTMAALDAGKHVLCEKPFASNADQAREMVERADQAGLVLMDAFHWRYHPLADRMGEVLDGNQLGEIRRVEAAFCAPIPVSDEVRHSWLLSGGALMDLGCYAVQWARFCAGEEPDVVGATMIEGQPKVDISAHIDLEFPSGATGHIFTAMVDCEAGSWVTVTGTKGMLQVDNPIHPHRGNKLILTVEESSTTEEVPGKSTYHYQLLAFCDAITNGGTPLTGGSDAVATMDVIDSAYLAAGLPLRGTGDLD